MAEKGLQLRSLMKASGELELSLAEVDIPKPGPNEVLIRLGASPVNPSDLGMLFGPADLSTIKASGTKERPVLTALLPPSAQKALAARIDKSMPVGNEGAGVVIDAGAGAAALKGKTVAALGGAMYAQYRVVHMDAVLELPAGATDAQGASSFVNPLTVLGMVDTLHREGHKALAHTAAASQLGQMLVRVCQADKIELVNVVRKEEQVKILKDLGAKHIVDSSKPSFTQDLEDAFAKAGVTLAFDATGGGKLPNQLLSAMERALTRDSKEFSRYGSDTHKQVYLYGALDTGPTELLRNYGMAWGIGGWLVMSYMAKIGKEAAGKLKERVGRELTTTFATQYAKELTLQQLLDPEEVKSYAQRTTGGKVLVRRNAAHRDEILVLSGELESGFKYGGAAMSNAVQLSARGERTKASLVAAAREVIARDGFVAARITDIASEAGAAVGSFYTYFESKDAIFRDVITAVADEFLVPREPGRDALERIEEGNRTYVRLWAKNARILAVWQHRTLEDPYLFEIRQRNLKAFHRRAERLIRQLQQEGRVAKEVRPRFTAMALSGMVFSFCYETFLVEGKLELAVDEIADGLTELWSRALGIRPAKKGQSK